MELTMNRRKGSALLVVLGMLAFMVMSATAFSIYMRQNRLPSSFLRQRIASSMLVKAALAEAMKEIDTAIGSDPYPNEYRLPREGSSEGGAWLFPSPRTGNYWRNRVYLGENKANGIDERDTVSPLCLEALAYLPPPLVNTVRYWSRRSPSCQWRYFGYDAGRWAYTAVNVSDYLDINSLRANVMRDSSLEKRISLAYRFETPDHEAIDSSRAKAFDDAMNKFAQNSTYGRLVSMADYSMAMGSGTVNSPDKGSLPYISPFCNYILNAGTSVEPFYGELSKNDICQQTFVTDSWHPDIPRKDELALSDFVNDDFFCDRSGQPLKASLDDLQKYAKGETPYEKIQQRLNLAALGALYDYIDEDNVPLSLALPTAERTPMLTGIQVVPKDFKVSFKKEPVKPEKDSNNPKVKVEHHNWWFNGLEGSLTVNLSAVFPFKRSSGITPGNYTAEVLVKGFLTDEPEKYSSLRMETDLRPSLDEWKGPRKRKFDSDGFFVARGNKPLTVPTSVLKPDQTDINVTAMDLDLQLDAPDKRKVYAFSVTITEDEDGNETRGKPEDDPASMGTTPFAYLNGAGKVVPVSAKSISAPSKDLSFVYLVWVRIVDSDGRTVDLAPATIDDDKLFNSIDHKLQTDLSSKLCGDKIPAFTTVGAGAAVKMADFTENAGDMGFNGDIGSLAMYCNDPRYNWAPEDWYETTAESGVSASEWRTKLVGVQNGDIFQFVSNCGYLQSMGEIQFLPFTGEFGAGKDFNPVNGDYFTSSKYNGQRRTAPGALANAAFMWESYWAFGQDRDTTNDMYDWGIVDSRGGVTVPPYSSNDDLFMAGLANTPYDWSVADSQNEYEADKIDSLCFNSRSSEAPMKWDDLLTIADTLREKFITQPDKYAEWPEWNAQGGTFMGASLDDFHAVDRKFLFSYWKNCYLNDQQLFLLFVRAEPTMMTGASGDRTPSQLGAKAVALVWREPSSTIDTSADPDAASGDSPHRMRILFYHQFD